MVKYTIEERILIIKEYIQIRNSLETQSTFRIQFLSRRVPYKFTIRYCYQNFFVHKTCLNRNKGNSVRPRTEDPQELH